MLLVFPAVGGVPPPTRSSQSLLDADTFFDSVLGAFLYVGWVLLSVGLSYFSSPFVRVFSLLIETKPRGVPLRQVEESVLIYTATTVTVLHRPVCILIRRIAYESTASQRQPSILHWSFQRSHRCLDPVRFVWFRPLHTHTQIDVA